MVDISASGFHERNYTKAEEEELTELDGVYCLGRKTSRISLSYKFWC